MSVINDVPEDMVEEVFAQLIEDRDSYTKDNVFWIPKNSRYNILLGKSSDPKIDVLLDNAIRKIEEENPKLRGVLYRDFARLPLAIELIVEQAELFADDWASRY